MTVLLHDYACACHASKLEQMARTLTTRFHFDDLIRTSRCISFIWSLPTWRRYLWRLKNTWDCLVSCDRLRRCSALEAFDDMAMFALDRFMPFRVRSNFFGCICNPDYVLTRNGHSKMYVYIAAERYFASWHPSHILQTGAHTYERRYFLKGNGV